MVSANDEADRTRARPRRDDAAGLRALLHAHCQDVVARLPRGGPGVHAAESLLFGIPEGVLRGVPDLIGGGLAIFGGAAAHGLIDGVPSAKIACAALNLIRPFTPLLEQKSARIRVLHLAGAWSRIAEIRRATPRPTAPPAAGPLVQPARKVDLRAELTRLDACVRALEAERADHHAKLTQLDTERSELHAQLGLREAEITKLTARTDTIDAAFAALHKFLDKIVNPSEIRALLAQHPDILPTKVEELQYYFTRLMFARHELESVEAELAARRRELGSESSPVHPSATSVPRAKPA